MVDREEEPAGDAAAQAFEGVRTEVALLRRAVEGLAAERAGAELPDYTLTLAQIAQAVRATAAELDRMSEAPALAITPETMAVRMAAAASTARREDRDTLMRARVALDHATSQLGGYMLAARTGHQQDRWLAAAGSSGLVLGMILVAAFAGAVARAAPESWRWPERMAASTLALPMWQAGLQLMRAADPATFRAIVADEKIATADRDAIAACGDAATKAHRTVKCTIKIEP